MIGCVWLPYAVAETARREAGLPAGAPLALFDERGRVQFFCAHAETAGVQAGMTIRQAALRCEGIHLLNTGPAVPERVMGNLRRALAAFSDSIAVQMTGQTAIGWLFGGEVRPADRAIWVRELGRAAAEATGLPPQIGLAESPFVAQVAAMAARPRRATVVRRGRAAAFLSPLPVTLLPLDADSAERLARLGIRTLGQLAALPAGALLSHFGWEGRRWQQLARGEDRRPLPWEEPAPRVQVLWSADDGLADRTILQNITAHLAQKLAEELQAARHACASITLRVTTDDGATRQHGRPLREPTAAVRVLTAAAQAALNRLTLSAPVTGLALRAEGLTGEAGWQLPLLPHPPADRLQEILGQLTARYGREIFFRVALVDEGARLPERRFRLDEAA